MPGRKGLLAPQNTFLDTIATRFDGTHSNFVLGNAQVPHAYPIVYCSDGFCELTGYSRAQIMQKGCACKFLYGDDTEENKRKEIENALQDKAELKTEVKFYKKSGTAFWCLLDIVPIKNEKREVVLFLASHKDITSSKQFSGMNHLPIPGGNALACGDHPNDTDDELHPCDPNGNLDPEAPTSYNYGRRRSRAVLYQLSGHYKTEKTKKIHSKLSTNSLLSPPATNIQPLPEYKTAVAKKPRWVLSHYGMVKTCWDILVLMATIYVAIVVPYNAAFHDPVICHSEVLTNVHVMGGGVVSIEPSANRTKRQEVLVKVEEEKKASIVLDVIVEAIFIIDILLNFRTTFVNKKGEVVSTSKSIAFHYMKGWFILDLIAALPFDVLYASELSEMDSESFTSIHLLKLTRLLRLARLLQKMDRYSQYSIVILTLLMMTFALLAHWMACIWYVIGTHEQPNFDSEADLLFPGWLNLLGQRMGLPNGGCIPHVDAYVTALYYTCTSLTTVGFGNVAANTKLEKIFSVVIMLIGALMHATILGNVTALVQRMYGARKSVYQTKWRDLKDFSILHSVPKHLKQRMQDYFQTMWSLNHGIDPVEILADYPEELRGDVSMHLHKEILSLPIFETASEGCRKLLSLTIKTNFCAPDEYLIHKGDALPNIYYLYNGSMEVLQEGMVVAILGKGDLVGCDIAKHLGAAKAQHVISSSTGLPEVIVKSSCDVRALTYCDLKCMNIPGLVEVLRLYPEFQDQFAEDIMHDLTFNLREGWEADYNLSEDGITPIKDGDGCGIASPTNSGSLEVEDNDSASTVPQQGNVASTEMTSTTNAQVPSTICQEQLDNLTLDVKRALAQLQRISTSGGNVDILPISSEDKQVQTEFPAAMLEDYVVKNRKRILKLLGLAQTGCSAGDFRSDNLLRTASVPRSRKEPSAARASGFSPAGISYTHYNL
ncbi:potassium voltage-gated channel subfamily H member 8-like [Tigriopus californicus]|uniref:potassium voltage-gated channel subfamily H member 8-like n=1 Tax=Tigriopus californicus TaxID=6832 RepID=UPI0027DA9A77|nr:potassium voltage-gated channel subfamily H member 8-like [Tigriopus californicus]